ncbi:MAG TPA: SDR family oxidoreductase [Amycolatopsis sp.]|nr:SDR family oxidoreductase [Amycolatopsis sp.]
MKVTPENLMAVARDVDNTILGPEDILLTDQVAVVTGGGGGIGQGIALGLAKFGADVVVLDSEPTRCAATQQAIERLGRRAVGVPCNVMDTAALTGAIDQAAADFGRLDILVNNAGGSRPGPLLTQPEASVRRHVEINLLSMVFATQAAAKHMIEGGRGGSIVNVTSIEGFRAAPNFAVYAACKAGMVNFSRTMALELSEYGIRTNAIAPDHTISPGTRGNRNGPVDPASWADSDLDANRRLIPLGREGVADECASVAVWLCSEMSQYVTGATINVDGGTWASSGWLRQAEGGWILNP